MQNSIGLDQLLAGLRLKVPRRPDDPRQVAKAAAQNDKLVIRALDKALKKVEAFEQKVAAGKKAVLKLGADLPVLRYDPRVDQVPEPLQLTVGDAVLAPGELRALPPAERLDLARDTLNALTGGIAPLPGPPPQATPPAQDPVTEALPPAPPVPAPAPTPPAPAPPPPPSEPLPVADDLVDSPAPVMAQPETLVELPPAPPPPPPPPVTTLAAVTSVGAMVGDTLATILPGFSTDNTLLTVSGSLSEPATDGQELLLRATPADGVAVQLQVALAAGSTAWQVQLPQLADGSYDIVAQVIQQGASPSAASPAYRQEVSAIGYDIDLVINTAALVSFGLSAQTIEAVLAGFDAAAARISQIIVGDLPSLVLIETSQPDNPLPILIDDLVIGVDFYMGEPLNVLASAGPNLIRSQSMSGGSLLPIFGTMEFDLLDIEFMLREDLFAAVALHEMAHVLGLGTLWRLFGLNTENSQPGGVRIAEYVGPNALREYNTLLDAAGLGATDATFVPLANEPGFAHWDEDLFGSELMTPFVAPGALPFSALSIGALADLGYTVNYAAADPYSLIGVAA